MTFTRTCKNGVFTGEMTYAGDSFAGVSRGQDAKGRPVTMKSTARRVGDCTK